MSTTRSGLHSIGNKMLAVLVAVAVLPAVAVSLYALRKATDALSEQALTLISEACTTDARHLEDSLVRVHQEVGSLAKENPDVGRLFEDLERDSDEAGRSGETKPRDAKEWSKLVHDLDAVDQKLRSLFDEQRSCRLAFVRSRVFRDATGRAVLRLERREGDVRSETLVQRDETGYLRPVPTPIDPTMDLVLQKWNEANEAHPDLDVLRETVVAPEGQEGEALELFAARVQSRKGRELGWIFLVHSWRALLQQLRTPEAGGAPDSGVSCVFESDAVRPRPIASSRDGAFRTVAEQEALGRHTRSGHAAALFETGEIVAFAPLLPRREDPALHYVLAVERPARELLDNVQRFRLVFASVLAAALLLSGLLAIAFARRLTRPLQVLRDGAVQIGRGDLRQTIEVHTGDEVEQLADEFNAMATQLRSLYGGMENTIRERTEQLQTALDELRRAHDQIVESEKRYSDIVENASDLIQVTDANGRIVSANRRQAELFGTPVKELEGRDFLDWVAADSRGATSRAFQHVLGGGTLQAYDSALVVASGRTMPVEISATPVVADGKPVGVRAILRDVSERKAIEARLIKAERLSSVGALAAGVAHEINNPLGIITMFAQRTLERARKGELDVDKLEKIVEQGKRVAGITRNLLDFARAAPTRFAPFDVGEVIENTCALVADRAKTATIEVERTIAPDLPKVVGNSQQISQVLLNLLLNAFQAIGKNGRVLVRAATTSESRLPTGGAALRVTVEDSGPGIPADVLPRLFEPFFTTKAPGEGTGLGLSVSYGILKEHHGAVFATNRAEGGARFEFELPLDVHADSNVSKSPIAAQRE
jgi:PAS domain S-box-containing protein